MADSDGSPQRDDPHHRQSRCCSPVSPEGAGETPAEREELLLAEAAVLVGPPAGQPRAASADTGPSTQEPEPAVVTAPAAQEQALPPRPGRGPQTREEQIPQPQRATPRRQPGPPARRRHGG